MLVFDIVILLQSWWI